MSSKGSTLALALKSFYQRLFLRSSEGEAPILSLPSLTFFTPATNVLPATNLQLNSRHVPDASFLPSTSILLY